MAFLGAFASAAYVFIRIGRLLEWQRSQDERCAHIERRFDNLVSAIIRRGEAEAVDKGWGEFRSPLHVTPAGLDAVWPVLAEILPFYAHLLAADPAMSQAALFDAIEARFGDLIVEKICIPHRITRFACIATLLKACEQLAVERPPTP